MATDYAGLVGDGVWGMCLLDELHREQMGEGFRSDRLVSAGVERRRGGLGQVGDNVVPGRV